FLLLLAILLFFFFSSRRRHTRFSRDWSSDVCSSDLEQRLFTWHSWLFPTDDQLLARPLHIGALRGEEPMQVVSGRIDRPTVHFRSEERRVGKECRCRWSPCQ